MTELSGLQLRKAACGALGLKPKISWIASRDGGESLAIEYAMQWDCDQWCKEHPGYATVRYENWPAIESDPAVAIPILVEFCDKHQWQWHLCKVDGVYNCWIEDITKDDFPEADGTSPCEAIARAIVAASVKSSDQWEAAIATDKLISELGKEREE